MEEETKKKKIISSKKSTINKKMERSQKWAARTELQEEFGDDFLNEEIYEEDSILLAEDVPEPEYDESKVLLSWYDSDLNLVIDERNFTTASPLHDGGFCYLQAGARATYGFNSGKVCFEVKNLQGCKVKFKKGNVDAHSLRVGWSPLKSCLQLGTDNKSYGFDNSGRISTIGEIADYGRSFKTGDVIGAFLDIGEETITLSFTVNGEDQGVAYQVPQSDIQKEALFPHISTKNISYECNFHGEKPWFPPKEGYTFVGDVPLSDRICGPKRPKSKSDCEVVMMCGLPKVGKTAWVNELRDKNPGKYYVLDTGILIDKQEFKDPDRKDLIFRKTRVMGKLLAIAMDRRRNYILDQINIVRPEQIWKLRFFKGFKRRIVVIVLPDEEYMKRINKVDDRPSEELSWLLRLKAKFVLPILAGSPLSSFTEKIEYVALPEDDALDLVKGYHREAWSLGYKPNKFFVIPQYMLKDMKKKGTWKKRLMSGPRDQDFLDSAGRVSPLRSRKSPPQERRLREEWHSPPRKRMNEDWPSPPRNRMREDWHTPPRKRMSGDWPPSRKRMNEDWPSPQKRMNEDWPSPRKRMNEDWPSPRKRMNEDWRSPPRNRPGGGLRSPYRGNRRDDSWPGEGRRREFSESPPRFRPGGRRESREGVLSPPRSRIEEWQSRGPRMREDCTSPPRMRSDVDVRPACPRSPPKNRFEPQNPDRNRDRFREREDSGHRYPDDNRGRQPPGDAMHADWPPRTAGMANEFSQQERSIKNIHPRDGRMSGEPPPHEIRVSGPPGREMDEGFPRGHRAGVSGGAILNREHGSSGSMLPQESRMSGGFPPGDARVRGGFPSPRQRMDNELPPREVRFGRDGMCSPEPRLGPGFPHQEHRMGEGFLHREGRIADDFPPRDVRVDDGLPPFKGRTIGLGCPPEDRMGRGFSPPHGRIGNDRSPVSGMPPPPQIMRGLPAHERRTGDMPPLEARLAQSVSPGRRMIADIQPRQGRNNEHMPPDRLRISADYPLPRGRGNGNFSSPVGRPGPDIPNPGGRIGMLPPDNRSGRMFGDLPSQRMSGDLPPSEGRMGGNFHPGVRLGGNLPLPGDRSLPPHEISHRDSSPSREFRMTGDLPPREGRMISDLPPHEGRIMGDLPPHEGRMMGDLPPREGRMMGDFPPQEGRMMGDFPPQEGRMMGDFPPQDGRMMGDLPAREGRMMGNLPPREGRMMGNLPPREGRMMGNLPPREGRMMGNLPTREGRMRGDLPPRERRMIENLPPQEGRMKSDFLPHEERNFPPPEGRNVNALPPQEGMLGGNILPHERMSGDFPPQGGRIGCANVPPPQGRMVGDMPTGGRMMGNFPPRGRSGRTDLPHRGVDMAPPEGGASLDFSQHVRIGNDVPPPGGRMIADLPPGGRMGNSEFPTEGRVGSGLAPRGGRIGSDNLHHGERSGGDLLPHGGRFGGDMPPHGIRMGGDQQHLDTTSRIGSGEHWNRLPTDHPSNFGLPVKQEPLNELQFRNKDDFLQSKGGDNGRGNRSSRWDRIPSNTDRPSNFGHPVEQEPLNKMEFRNKEGFPQSKVGGDGGGMHQDHWNSQPRDIHHHSFKSEGENRGSGVAASNYHFLEDRESENSGRLQSVRGPSTWKPGEPSASGWKAHEAHKSERSPSEAPRGSGRRPNSPSLGQLGAVGRSSGARGSHDKHSSVGPRQNIQPPVGRHGRPLSPGQPMSGQQPPGGPKLRNDDRTPHEVRRSPVGRPESGRQSPVPGGSGGWQHPSRKGRAHWQSSERSHPSEGGRLPLNIDRAARHSPPRKQPRITGPSVLYPDGEIEDDIPHGPVRKPPQRSGVGVKNEPVGREDDDRLPEEDAEELAPYEQPFNQSVWDSNEPDAGMVFHSGSEAHGGKIRESGGNRPQDSDSRSGSKTHGSVWQRVGGYVDDDEDRGNQSSSGSRRFGNQNLSGGPFGDSKERSRDFEEVKRDSRRGHEMKEDSRAQSRFSPFHADRGGYSRGGGSRGHWRSPDKSRAPRARW